MRLLLRLTISLLALILFLSTALLFIPRQRDPAQPVMILDQGHINDNDWRLYWFVPELNYLRPFTAPLYDTRVIGWWHDWLYYSANTGWFEDTTGNQLRNIYRVRAGQNTPQLVTGPVIIRGLKWLPDRNRIVYPAPIDVNRTDLYSLNLANGKITNLTSKMELGIAIRRLPFNYTVDGKWVFPIGAELPNPSFYAASTDGQKWVYQPLWLDTDLGLVSHNWSILSTAGGLYRIGTEGQIRKISESPRNNSVDVWSPTDGVMVTGEIYGDYVTAYSLRNGMSIWRKKGHFLTYASKQVYIRQSDGSTVKIPLLGGTPEPVADDIAVLWGWTPDGHWLIYQDGNANLRRFDPITHQTETIRPFTNAYIYNVGPSPDSQWWLFLESTPTNTALKRIRPDGRDEQQLLLLEGDATTPTTLFGTWTPPFQKHWQALPLLVFALLLALAPQLKNQLMRFF